MLLESARPSHAKHSNLFSNPDWLIVSQMKHCKGLNEVFVHSTFSQRFPSGLRTTPRG